PKNHIKIKTEPDFPPFIFDNIFANSVGKLHHLPSSKREGRRRLALHSAAIVRRGNRRFPVDVNGNRDFPLSVRLASRPGYFSNGARPLNHFAVRFGPPKFRFAFSANLHCFGENEVLGRITIISVSGESQGQLRSHYRGSPKPFPIQIGGLVDLFVGGRRKGVKPLGQSCPFRRGASRIGVYFMPLLTLHPPSPVRQLHQPPVIAPPRKGRYSYGRPGPRPPRSVAQCKAHTAP